MVWRKRAKMVCTTKEVRYCFTMLISFSRDWNLLNNFNVQQTIGIQGMEETNKHPFRESIVFFIIIISYFLKWKLEFWEFQISNMNRNEHFIPSVLKIMRRNVELVDFEQPSNSSYAFSVLHEVLLLLFRMSKVTSLTLLCLFWYSVNLFPFVSFVLKLS